MNKPKLTEKVLEDMVLLAKKTEGIIDRINWHPQSRLDFISSFHQRYIDEVKPSLEPFAKHYIIVKSQMDHYEQMYGLHIEKAATRQLQELKKHGGTWTYPSFA